MPDRIDLTRTPPPTELLAPGGAMAIAVRTCLLEGPAFDAEGVLYFSDIIGDRIYRLTTDGALSVFREESGRTNGNTFDASGRLISCEEAIIPRDPLKTAITSTGTRVRRFPWIPQVSMLYPLPC